MYSLENDSKKQYFFASYDLGFERWSHYVALTDLKP